MQSLDIQPDTSNYLYRTARMEDLEQLKKLGLLAYGQYKLKLTEENWKKMETSFTTGTSISDILQIAHGFVCELNSFPVGMAFLVPHGHPNQLFQEEWAQIRFVGVHPEHTGKGIGRSLTALCIQKARETGERTIALHTSEMMGAAPRLYESFGFTIHRVFEHFGKEYRIYLLKL